MKTAIGVLAVACAALLAGCAPRRLVLPSGPGTPVSDFRAPFEQASAPCASVRTITAEMRLSGRAGSQKMRGTVLAGFEAPDSIRLEGVAPFGPPAFILVSHAGSATLLLPRDDRVLTGASAAQIIEALAGISVDPATLRAILAGCLAARPQPSNARSYSDGWMAIDVAPNATAYLRQQEGRWQIAAGRVGRLNIDYRQFADGRPQQIIIQSGQEQSAGVAVNLALALSQVTINTDLKPAAFEVKIPAGASALTLDELRRAGPLK